MNSSNLSLIKTSDIHLKVYNHVRIFLDISLIYLASLLVNIVCSNILCKIFYASNISVSIFFVSKAGVPSKPGIPKLLEGSKNSIQWEKADENGSRLLYYILEIRYVCLQQCFVNCKELSG